MSEFNFNQHCQQFIENINETHSVFNNSLALIQHYKAVISSYETHNRYLVNLYNRAYKYFGISWEVFVENNEDYDYFEREVINQNPEEGEELVEIEEKIEENVEKNLNFDGQNIISISDDDDSACSCIEYGGSCEDCFIKKEHNENYRTANSNNFYYESDDDGYEEFLQKREYNSYDSYLEDKNIQNFEYYMSQRSQLK
ncbi:906_t:CDS:2 [Cetraspora pellucida]|uniref:906_t:CDS:1 n=1 Tax=Cetraspora pellucida TaxID=1433469 RepID=A0A9N9NNR7_9GLOM|nr:906_t:CDS:2 [Cetraspora pellucida]